MPKEEINKIKDNSFGTAAVVLAILSITFSTAIAKILGINGLVFAKKQKNIMKNSWSKVGIILNIIGIILGIAVFTFALINFLKNPQFLAQFQGLANAQ